MGGARGEGDALVPPERAELDGDGAQTVLPGSRGTQVVGARPRRQRPDVRGRSVRADGGGGGEAVRLHRRMGVCGDHESRAGPQPEPV